MLTPSPKFLLDENIRVELTRFLKSKGFDVRLVPRSSADSLAASFSKREKRVLVTNNVDFCEYTEDGVFGVIWLRIPQNNPKGLVASFEKFLGQEKNLVGRLIILEPNKESDFPLSKNIKFDKRPK